MRNLPSIIWNLMGSRKSTVNSDLRKDGQPILEKPGPAFSPASKKGPRGSYKSFQALKANQKKNRLRPITNMVEKFLEENKDLSYTQLMGYVCRTIAYKNKDVESAAKFSKLAKGESLDTGSQPMPIQEAVALKTYTYSGRSSWGKFTKACKRRNFIIPSR